jgi:ribosomal protein S18 acetylase RimI-like enzyme
VVASAEASPAVIRRATEADLPVLGRMGALLVQTHHDFDPRRFIAPTAQTEQAYAAFLGRQLGDPDIVVLVAERADTVVGYSYAGVEGTDYMALRGPAGAIYDILIEPRERGQGIGRLLLDATIAALSARGVPRIVLSTADRNEAAQRLFARAGFRRTMIEMTREVEAGESTDAPG